MPFIRNSRQLNISNEDFDDLFGNIVELYKFNRLDVVYVSYSMLLNVSMLDILIIFTIPCNLILVWHFVTWDKMRSLTGVAITEYAGRVNVECAVILCYNNYYYTSVIATYYQ